MANPGGIALAATLLGEAQPKELGAGDTAGEYEIVRRIGAGAMGEVYEGKHPVIGKKVAIKVIKQVLAASEESAQRFIREAQAVNHIDHPNVLDVFAFGRLDDGRLYLVMDLLAGCSLDVHLRTRGKLPVDEFLEVMEPICLAVAAAHKAGVIHRDLKPANVFLARSDDDSSNKVFVLDFGVAKLMSSAEEQTGQTLTGQGVWIGTPAYMAPEQWTAEGASTRSDIYALGAMSYELLTGSSPFVADSIPGVMEKHFHAEIPGPKESGVSIPGHIDAALRKAMAKDPEDRFASAEELWAAFQGKVRIKPRRRNRVSSTARGSKLPIVMGVALVVVAGASLAILRTRSENEGLGAGAGAPPPAGQEPRAFIDSMPAGAIVERDGSAVGKTPMYIVVAAGTQAPIKLRKPGYVSREVLVGPGPARQPFELTPVVGFEGVWRTPEGDLRRFARDRDRVVAYKVASAREAGSLYRFFTFVDAADDAVVFEAKAEHVDEELPNEPSCRMSLAAQYRFDPQTSLMSLRREKLAYDKLDGQCVVKSRNWGAYQPVVRIDALDSSRARSVESRAGTNPLSLTNNGNAAKNEPLDVDKAAQFDGAKSPIAPNRKAQKQKPTAKTKTAKKVPPKKPTAKKPVLKKPTAKNRQLKSPPVRQEQSKAPPVQNAAPQRKGGPEPQQLLGNQAGE